MSTNGKSPSHTPNNLDVPSTRPSLKPLSLQTTGIGSLPHHNLDAALDYSFRHDIPYLPQIPIRNPWEYMIPQALEGLPGLRVDSDGQAQISLPIWSSHAKEFTQRLREGAENPAIFEPSSSTSAAWQAFTWELEERESRIAKIQIAGPITCQLALRLERETLSTSHVRVRSRSIDQEPELGSQIFSLILLRAQAMVGRLKRMGITPIVFIDEPGLLTQGAAHSLGFRELALLVAAVQKAGAIVGVHCCSETHWQALEATGVDLISLDAQLSLSSLLEAATTLSATEAFLGRGGRLSLGVIPTALTSLSATPAPVTKKPRKTLSREPNLLTVSSEKPQTDHGNSLTVVELIRESALSAEGKRILLRESLLTPACGLALLDPRQAEEILSQLQDQQLYLKALATGSPLEAGLT
jgi:hypothetical protein